MPNYGKNAAIGGGGFHHIALRAFDFEATLKFYVEGLGFTWAYGWGEDGRSKGEKDSRAAMLDTGDGNYLEVFAGGPPPAAADSPEGTLIHFALRTDDTAVALERAREAGATVTMETKVFMPPNADPVHPFRIAFVRGLNGEVVEFFQNDTL